MSKNKTTKVTIIDEVRGEKTAFQIVTEMFKGIERDFYETSVYPISMADNSVTYGTTLFFEQNDTLGDAFACHLKTVGRYLHGAR